MGAKVDNGGSDTITPLMWAAKRDQAYLVSNILDYGADVTLVSNEGRIYINIYIYIYIYIYI